MPAEQWLGQFGTEGSIRKFSNPEWESCIGVLGNNSDPRPPPDLLKQSIWGWGFQNLHLTRTSVTEFWCRWPTLQKPWQRRKVNDSSNVLQQPLPLTYVWTADSPGPICHLSTVRAGALIQHRIPSRSAYCVQAPGLTPVFSRNLQLSYFASKLSKLAIHVSAYHSNELI